MDDDLRALANSVIWPGFLGSSAPSWLLDELEHSLAGAVYFAHNLPSPGSAAELSAQLRAVSPSALIGVDEEGGTVTRLHSRTGSPIPGAGLLGAIGDPALTARTNSLIAAECRGAGVNVVLAPVADVNVNPDNPVIGVRAFGADPEAVSRHVAAAVGAWSESGIACCAKHFPGHGDTSTDSHLALPISGADAESQQQVHLAPFRAAVTAGAPAVMSAHIVVPHLGSEPSTLNPEALDLLRGLGFEGVIISDALDMAAIAQTHGIGPGGVLALAAGCDLLCVGNPANADEPNLDRNQFTELQAAIVDALRDGTLPRVRVEQAAGRVRELAAAVALPPAGPPESVADKDFADPVLDSELLAAVEEFLIAQHPPRLDLDRRTLLLDLRRRRNLAEGVSADRFAGALEAAGLACDYHRPDPDQAPPTPTAGEQVIVLTDDLTIGGPQQRTATAAGPTIVVHVGIPVSGDVLPNCPVLNCYESSAISAHAVAAVLIGGR